MKLITRISSLTASLLLFAGTVHGAEYTVQPGDSLWRISAKYKTTVSELMSINNLTSDMLYSGQTLKVPGPTVYVVKNETMWEISQIFGVPLDELIKANPQITNPNNIWSGLTIFIPETDSSPTLKKPTQFTDGLFPLAKGTYQLPLINNYNDGRTWSPSGDSARKHEGVDVFAKKGTPIYSVMDGEIINFGWNEYGGWRITVRVDDSTAFYYAHLSKYADGIGKGSKVKKGQLLGYVGNTGYGPVGTEGQFDPHLHFGIYKTDSSSWYTIDPFSYLQWWEKNR